MPDNTHKISVNIQGVAFLILGMLIFSLQDIVVKWMGGDYPVLEIVAFRSVVALPLTLLFFRAEGGRGLPTTKRPMLEYVRGLFFFCPTPPTLWAWRRCPWPISPLLSFLHP